jgi:hypothetical protein
MWIRVGVYLSCRSWRLLFWRFCFQAAGSPTISRVRLRVDRVVDFTLRGRGCQTPIYRVTRGNSPYDSMFL